MFLRRGLPPFEIWQKREQKISRKWYEKCSLSNLFLNYHFCFCFESFFLGRKKGEAEAYGASFFCFESFSLKMRKLVAGWELVGKIKIFRWLCAYVFSWKNYGTCTWEMILIKGLFVNDVTLKKEGKSSFVTNLNNELKSVFKKWRDVDYKLSPPSKASYLNIKS